MRAVRWLLAAAFVLTTLSGCLSDEPAPPPVEEPAPLNPYVHVAIPNVTRDLPLGPGAVRYVANDMPNETRLFGFNLSADPADWGGSSAEWYRMAVDVVPFGDVTEWAVFFFDGGRLHTEAISVPDDTTIYYESPLFAGTQHEGDGTRIMFTEQNGPRPFQVVAAIKGDGGLAFAPTPSPELGSPPEPLAVLLERPGGEPPLLGNGTGMSHAAYVETVSATLAMRAIVGDVAIADRMPADTRPVTPIMDMTVSAPEGFAGWTDVAGMYSAADAHGEWSAELTSTETETFGGQVSFAATQPSGLAPLPWFFGIGDTNASTTSSYSVFSVTEGAFEALRYHHTTLGAPLAQLLGTGSPLETISGTARGGEVVPESRMLGGDLVIDWGDRTTIYVDSVA